MKTSVSGVLVVIESSCKRWSPTKLAFSAAREPHPATVAIMPTAARASAARRPACRQRRLASSFRARRPGDLGNKGDRTDMTVLPFRPGSATSGRKDQPSITTHAAGELEALPADPEAAGTTSSNYNYYAPCSPGRLVARPERCCPDSPLAPPARRPDLG